MPTLRLVATDSQFQRDAGPMTTWLKRIAAAGFLFFLVKGLVWLGIGLALLIWSL